MSHGTHDGSPDPQERGRCGEQTWRQHWRFYAFSLVVLLAIVFLFAPYAPPGADGDSLGVLRTAHGLVTDFKYRISRRPGQPLLDLANMVAWSFAGKAGVLCWYALVAYAGILAYYHLCVRLGIRAAALAASCLLLCPHFVSNVSGVGDYTVSLSLFLVALCLVVHGRYGAGTLAFVACMAVRLNYCVLVFALAACVYLKSRAEGAGRKRALWQAGLMCGGSALAAAMVYAPIYAFYRDELRIVLPLQSLAYHVVTPTYRIICFVLGIPLCLLIAGGTVARMLRRTPQEAPANPWLIRAIVFCTIVPNVLVLARFPSKPEIVLPSMAVLLIYLAAHHGKVFMRWVLALWVLQGLVFIDLRDPRDDSLTLRVEDGFYFKAYNAACKNRWGAENARKALGTLPPRSMLIGRGEEPMLVTPEPLGSKIVGAHRPLRFVTRFKGVDGERYLVHFLDRGIGEFLKKNQVAPESERFHIFYDPDFAALVRRWQHVDLAQYGQPVKVNERAAGLLKPGGVYLLPRGLVSPLSSARPKDYF